MKRLAAFLILVTAIGLIAHGVPVPRWVWNGYLTELQTRLPEYDVQIDSVVLGLSHKPVLMLSDIQVKNKTNADRLDVGLLRVELNKIAAWRRNEWVISDLTLKGLHSLKTTSQDCEGLPIRCWHSMPLRVWAQVKLMLENEVGAERQLRKVDIQKMEWVDVELRNRSTNQPQSQPQPTSEFEFGLSIEELRYQSPLQSGLFSDDNSTGTISAGLKLFDTSAATTSPSPPGPAPQHKPNQIYISVKANQALLNTTAGSRAWKFDNLESEFTGDWLSVLDRSGGPTGSNSYPWSGSVAAGSLILRHDEGSPFLKLQASELRSYVSRLDSPADHQAAFSARQVEGGLPAQDFLFKQAEWTYTHEDAEAWTFDLLLKQASDSSTMTAEITPTQIPGSEATPALRQTRVLGCDASTSYWFWQDGWFMQQGKPPRLGPGASSSWVWCKK